MKIFTIGPVASNILANDSNQSNARDVYISNTGSAVAFIQIDNAPASTSTGALGPDVALAVGVGIPIAAGATFPLVGYRPGSRTGSMGVKAICATSTTLVVQSITVTKTLP